MSASAPEAALENDLDTPGDSESLWVTLHDGSSKNLAGLNVDQLGRLQWVEEQAFARRILESPRGSRERAEAFRQGYDTVLTILRRAVDPQGRSFAMGLDPRYRQVVVDRIRRQTVRLDRPARFFEIGYAAGILLEAANQAGALVSGIEVSEVMHRMACERLPLETHSRLFRGDFLTHPLAGSDGKYDLIYWNDVFEHIAPDEIRDFLARIHRLLAPGGELITVTPNWHMRPSDITAMFAPRRTTARGFHLKEYTLREVTELLEETGFQGVATPLLVTPRRAVLCGKGLAGCKRWFEPWLECLPYWMARKGCIALGLGCTIARK